MNFKFPAFSPIPLETIVPNCSPDGLTLISDLLSWNPADRPTSSSVFRSLYFIKDPPAAAVKNAAASTSNRNGNASAVRKSNIVKVKAELNSSYKSSIPVAQSDHSIHHNATVNGDSKATEGILKSSATYSDLSIAKKSLTRGDSVHEQHSNGNNASIDGHHHTSLTLKPTHASLNDISHEASSNGKSHLISSSDHNVSRANNVVSRVISSFDENNSSTMYRSSSLIKETPTRELFISDESTHHQQPRSNRRDSNKQQRMLQDFISGGSFSSDTVERKENVLYSLNRQSSSNDITTKKGNQSNGLESPSSPLSKMFSTSNQSHYSNGHTGDEMPVNPSAKQMYMSRSRYIAGQPYKSYPGQMNPGSNHSSTSRSAGE